jgi:hypothetical protein
MFVPIFGYFDPMDVESSREMSFPIRKVLDDP